MPSRVARVRSVAPIAVLSRRECPRSKEAIRDFASTRGRSRPAAKAASLPEPISMARFPKTGSRLVCRELLGRECSRPKFPRSARNKQLLHRKIIRRAEIRTRLCNGSSREPPCLELLRDASMTQSFGQCAVPQLNQCAAGLVWMRSQVRETQQFSLTQVSERHSHVAHTNGISQLRRAVKKRIGWESCQGRECILRQARARRKKRFGRAN